MKKYLNIAITLFIAAMFALTAQDAFPQSSNFLSRRCPGLAPSPAYATVEITKTGQINIVPCATKTVSINGTSSAGLITSLNGLTTPTQTFAVGTSGTNFTISSTTSTHTFNFPNSSAANRGLLLAADWATFNSKIGSLGGLTAATQLLAVGAADTAAFSSVTATHTLNLPITAVTGSSRTNYFPNFSAANTLAKSPFSWDGTTFNWRNTALNNTFQLQWTPHSTNGLFTVGIAATSITVDQSAGEVQLTGVANLVGITNLQVNKTNSGTVGNVTINKPAGVVTMGSGSSSFTVTNSLVTTSSVILLTPQQIDVTCGAFTVDKSAGSFQVVSTLISDGAADTKCTADTKIGFLVLN